MFARINKYIAGVFRTVTTREGLKSLFNNSLYRNASYLMIANLLNGLFGFIFWIMVARIYDEESVGLASAIISGMMLMANISHLGMGIGLIRFIHKLKNNSIQLTNSNLTVGILMSLLSSMVFLLGLDFWSPDLLFVRHNIVYMISFTIVTIIATLTILVESVFLATRTNQFMVFKNIILNILRISLPFVLAIFFKSFGIFASWGISMGVALAVSLIFFLPKTLKGYRFIPRINVRLIKSLFRYSIVNYVAEFMWNAPLFILPIMVTNILGAESNAYFYIAWTIGNMLAMVARSASTSLFAEGSYDENALITNMWRSIRWLVVILVPIVLVILIFADKFLLLYGQIYSVNSADLLRYLSLATLPMALNLVYFSVKRVQLRLGIIIGLTLFITALTLGLSYYLLPGSGINGVGISWLISHSIVAIGILIDLLRRQFFRSSVKLDYR